MIENTENLTNKNSAGTVGTRIERTSNRKVRVERKRVSLTEQQSFPSVRIPEGYAPRWVNDYEDKLYRYVKAGWDFLDRETGDPTDSEQRVQDTAEDREKSFICKTTGGITAYLMVIKQKYADEHQLELEKKNNAVDDALLSPTIGGTPESATLFEVDINGKVSSDKFSAKTQTAIDKMVEEKVRKYITNLKK